jgi:ubiquinone/menaquinone biosynthesis C-methylase UbiE
MPQKPTKTSTYTKNSPVIKDKKPFRKASTPVKPAPKQATKGKKSLAKITSSEFKPARPKEERSEERTQKPVRSTNRSPREGTDNRGQTGNFVPNFKPEFKPRTDAFRNKKPTRPNPKSANNPNSKTYDPNTAQAPKSRFDSKGKLTVSRGNGSNKTEEGVRTFDKDETSYTHWGNVATWYDKMIEDKDSYQNKVIIPNLIKSMNIKKNEVILDIGCGVGYFCQKFFEKGGDIIGVDLGAESIKIAKQKTDTSIDYHVAGANQMAFVEDNSVDKITIVLALQNIKEADECIKECSRVLKPRGSLYIVLNHPYYRIPKATSWIFQNSEMVNYRRVDRYLSQFEINIDMNPGSKTKAKESTVSFHRPLEYYINTMSKNSLLLKSMSEWISHRQSDQGPAKTPILETSRKEIPLFMFLEFRRS